MRSLSAFYGGDTVYEATRSAVLPVAVRAVPGASLAAAANFATGLPFAVRITLGNFNGDGYDDVAASSGTTLSLFPGSGDGKLGTPVNSPTHFAQGNIVSADFNGDGKTDLALCDQGVSILLGDSGGSFRPETTNGNAPCLGSLAVGDFNGDGKADVVTTSSILLGYGDGTFQNAASYSGGSGPVSVTVEDFNADGHADLAVANSDGSVQILLGTGTGSFRAAALYGAGTSPVSLVSGDFNGDGKPDLATANQGGDNVSVLLGNGDGTFQHAVMQSAGAKPTSLAVGDFNGDGAVDLAVTNFNGASVSVLLGNGDGTFQPPTNYAAGAGANSLAIGDLNGDGIADLVVGSNNGVNVLLGTATKTTSTAKATVTTLTASPNPSNYGEALTIEATVSPAGATGLVTFFDGVVALGSQALASGKAGLTASRLLPGLHQLSAYYGGDPNYSPSRSAPLAQSVIAVKAFQFQSPVNYPGGTAYSVAKGDFNGDGNQDLAVAYDLNRVSILLNNGDGSFRQSGSYAADGALFLAIGDFNNDGNTDIAVPGFGVLLGLGDGTFRTLQNNLANYRQGSVVSGDFDGDGKADIALTFDLENFVGILLGKGDGTFQPAVNYATGNGSFAVATDDFNRDGHADLVVSNYFDGTVSVLLGNGDGSFRLAVNYGAGTQPRSVAVADFNGDGLDDVALADESSSDGQGSVTVLLGNGDGTFGTAAAYGVGNLATSISVAEFNGDGKPDLVVANFTDNTISVLDGVGDGSFQMVGNYSVASPRSVVTGDFNKDGGADVAAASLNGASVLLSKPSGLVPTISPGGVVNAASFLDGSASGAWLTIFGANLSVTTRTWTAADFNGTSLPTSLDGVSVTINGKAAYVYYVSPNQVSVLAPVDSTTGPLLVQVVNSAGSSNFLTVTKKAIAPEFFSYPQQSGRYVIAQDGLSYAALGPAGLLGPGEPTRPTMPGEIVILYATGLGGTNPPSTDGQIIQTPITLPILPQVLIGGASATVQFAGVVEAGLYQLNVVVRTIRIRDLLHHVSGLPDYEELMVGKIGDDFFRSSKGPPAAHEFTSGEVLKTLSRQPKLNFAPGSRFEYSNSGYEVLGQIIERVSGERYAEFLKEKIFDPLDMRHTLVLDERKHFGPRLALAYRKRNGRWEDITYSPENYEYGDGGVESTGNDLVKWDQALGAGKLVRRATLDLAFTPGRTNDGKVIETHFFEYPSAYGFGWFVSSEDNAVVLEHDGDWSGYRTHILRVPSRRVTAIVLTNSSNDDVRRIAHRMIEIARIQ